MVISLEAQTEPLEPAQRIIDILVDTLLWDHAWHDAIPFDLEVDDEARLGVDVGQSRKVFGVVAAGHGVSIDGVDYSASCWQ